MHCIAILEEQTDMYWYCFIPFTEIAESGYKEYGKTQNLMMLVVRNAEHCRTCKNIGTTENADLAFFKFCNAEIQRDNTELVKKK